MFLWIQLCVHSQEIERKESCFPNPGTRWSKLTSSSTEPWLPGCLLLLELMFLFLHSFMLITKGWWFKRWEWTLKGTWGQSDELRSRWSRQSSSLGLLQKGELLNLSLYWLLLSRRLVSHPGSGRPPATRRMQNTSIKRIECYCEVDPKAGHLKLFFLISLETSKLFS